MKTKTKTKTKSNHQASSPDTVSDFSHTKQKHCAHCGTTDTPQWRRAPEGGCLCNACGLKTLYDREERNRKRRARYKEKKAKEKETKSQ